MKKMFLSDAFAALAMAQSGADRIFGHGPITRMIQRHGRSRRGGYFDPRINRHTGKLHEHRREIARRTTRPGTHERRAAMELSR